MSKRKVVYDDNPESFIIEDGKLLYYTRGCDGIDTLVVPACVRVIGKEALSGSNFKHVRFSGPVETIERRAFYGCRDMESIEFSSGLKSIGNEAFSFCEKLREICLPDGVETVGMLAFQYDWALQKLTIPQGLKHIDSLAFLTTRSLSQIEVDERNSKYRSIDGSLYTKSGKKLLRAKSETEELAIPSGVMRIARYACSWCHIQSVKIPSGVITIGENAFVGCLRLKRVEIADSVTHIGDHAFIRSAIESVRIPAGMESVEEGTFEYCDSLESVVIAEGVKFIKTWAFHDCRNLESVVIPRSLERVGFEAFGDSKSLRYVYFLGTREEWPPFSAADFNEPLLNAEVYFYSETEPEEKGNFWRYVDGEIEPWTRPS